MQSYQFTRVTENAPGCKTGQRPTSPQGGRFAPSLGRGLPYVAVTLPQFKDIVITSSWRWCGDVSGLPANTSVNLKGAT